jgi:hypothetical protein
MSGRVVVQKLAALAVPLALVTLFSFAYRLVA